VDLVTVSRMQPLLTRIPYKLLLSHNLRLIMQMELMSSGTP
jgi:hypothetical protein